MDWRRFLRALSIPFLVAGLVTACSKSAPITPSATPSFTPSPTPGYGSGSVICGGPLDTATTVSGVVSERTPDGIQPIGGAIVELFSGDSRVPENILDLNPVKETLTRADGGYFMCLPPPIGGTGGTGPGGQPFEVRVRKNGYRTATQSFRFVYSVWDYGGVEVSLELVRD
jgi:hypothetical protein